MRRKQRTKEEMEEYKRHYSERAFWRKLAAMPRTAGLAVVEKAVTLYVILADRETPAWARLLILGVLGYFVWPMDAVWDGLPLVGYADDAAAMALVLTRLGRLVTPAVRGRVQRLLPEGMRTETKERRDKGNEQVESKETGN